MIELVVISALLLGSGEVKTDESIIRKVDNLNTCFALRDLYMNSPILVNTHKTYLKGKYGNNESVERFICQVS